MHNANNASRLLTAEIPGPSPFFLLGSRGNLILFFQDPIGYMTRLYREYGNIAAMSKGSQRGFVFAFGSGCNQKILTQPDLFLNAGITYSGPEGSANQRISRGLLSMNGAEHRRHRQLLTPSFHPKLFENYFHKIVSLTDLMLTRWETCHYIDLTHEMNQLTKLISGSVLLGLEDEQDIFKFSNLLVKWRDFNFSIARTLPFNFPGSPYRTMLKLAEQIETMLRRIIQSKRGQLQTDGKDVLSNLLRMADVAGNHFSDEVLIGHANLLFGASYETTASALMWTLFLLTQHPNVTAHLLDELTPLFEDIPADASALDKAFFLKQVIDESLRILPPAVYSCRIAAADTELGSFEIPKKTTVAFSHYMTHHSEELFPNPNRFDPDRWTAIKPSPFQYLPFGYGAHICLGASFAMLTMKIVLAMVLKRFRLTVADGSRIDRKVSITLGVKKGIPVTVLPQDREFGKSKTGVRGNIHEMVDLNF